MKMNELQLWMTENAMSVKLQLLELKKQHDISCVESYGLAYLFKKGKVDSMLANYVDGKTFNSDWTELEVRGVVCDVKEFSKSLDVAIENIPTTFKESVTLDPARRWLPTKKDK
jgi:hypothetical protein